ncbi:MAG: hypothetical protein J5I93_22195 [Pirellulaceae bacterium]|nr:hypothetical protein [Pirellulaceae bacterium]
MPSSQPPPQSPPRPADRKASENTQLPEDLAVIVVDHGSRRAESNRLLLDVVDAFRRLGLYAIVEPAHMELAEPSLATAYERCVAAGARRIVVFPYFLSPGRHWSQDIPALAAAAASQHPGTTYLVAAPLGLHPLMLRIMDERIRHCLDHAQGAAGQCSICQDMEGCQFRQAPGAKPS